MISSLKLRPKTHQIASLFSSFFHTEKIPYVTHGVCTSDSPR